MNPIASSTDFSMINKPLINKKFSKPGVEGGNARAGADSSARRSGWGCLGNGRGGSFTRRELALTVTDGGFFTLEGGFLMIVIPFRRVSSWVRRIGRPLHCVMTGLLWRTSWQSFGHSAHASTPSSSEIWDGVISYYFESGVQCSKAKGAVKSDNKYLA